MKMRASMSDGTQPGTEYELLGFDEMASLERAARSPTATPDNVGATRWIAQCTWENRKQRRAGVATFKPHKDMPKAEAKGLRRKMLKQRQRARVPKLDPETRRLAAIALAVRRNAQALTLSEPAVMAKLLEAFLQNPPATADEITRRYPQDLATQILAELERKANL
jgi:hypothetical protein